MAIGSRWRCSSTSSFERYGCRMSAARAAMWAGTAPRMRASWASNSPSFMRLRRRLRLLLLLRAVGAVGEHTVSFGPGDPELVTLKAARLIGAADLHDLRAGEREERDARLAGDRAGQQGLAGSGATIEGDDTDIGVEQEGEDIIVSRDVALARMTGGRTALLTRAPRAGPAGGLHLGFECRVVDAARQQDPRELRTARR